MKVTSVAGFFFVVRGNQISVGYSFWLPFGFLVFCFFFGLEAERAIFIMQTSDGVAV